MPLPKTYWNDLSEEAQIALFDFYIDNIDNIDRCQCCPGYKPKEEDIDCADICTVLFQRSHKGEESSHCPCHTYDPDDAWAALEKALIDNGWIENESVC